VVGESCVIIYGHTHIVDYLINSISKYIAEFNIPPFSMVCFYFCFISFLLPCDITRGNGNDFLLSAMWHFFSLGLYLMYKHGTWWEWQTGCITLHNQPTTLILIKQLLYSQKEISNFPPFMSSWITLLQYLGYFSPSYYDSCYFNISYFCSYSTPHPAVQSQLPFTYLCL
jgi:hypothetical protein